MNIILSFAWFFHYSRIDLGVSCVPELQFLFRMVRLDTICGVILVLSCFHALLGFPRSIRGLWFVGDILRIFMAFSGFGDRSKHSVRSRDLIHVPNGVVRCGFGLLFVGFVRI